MSNKRIKPARGLQPQDKKDLARSSNDKEMANNFAWVDRVAKEMRAQREYSEKWGALNDPKLYLGEIGHHNKPPRRDPPTKWSAYSIINTPKRNPLSSRPGSADLDAINELAEHAFKITGARLDYLSAGNNRHPTYPQPKARRLSTAYLTSNVTGDTISDRQSGSSKSSSKLANTFPMALESHTLSNRANQSPSSSSSANCGALHEAAVVAAPYNAVFQMQAERLIPPAQKYSFPMTNNMEYGWVYGGRNSLELFGSTSADFTKEAWKSMRLRRP